MLGRRKPQACYFDTVFFCDGRLAEDWSFAFLCTLDIRGHSVARKARGQERGAPSWRFGAADEGSRAPFTSVAISWVAGYPFWRRHGGKRAKRRARSG
jgi:hypothetical protein